MRKPDFIIGEEDNPYLFRWYIIPKNRWFNIYLHKFMRSDDDRALHDHPWSWNISVLLKGMYIEHMKGAIQKIRRPFRPIFRWGTTPHRIELIAEEPVWTLFITGRHVREWGFHCPKGWRHHKEFVSVRPGGNAVGKGCED